ncbi:DNA-binding PadR family transcriptional regulator [Clostridium tetanomorphum]|uniref:Helix-turn-helix transcriptional regulator n=1 Tax=Clostridium tetanomorphum TaxID=1553 RepID=A0A923EAM6_CLOTT|nr:PadR family transcriptional regulator [Clostridium tetanomorphum]KAJ53140.1 transcriptional regulator [Clostridium tetanomorphum DSM 665]MBC2396935.1 helix-turn-helix transcriptional regulator [Clostridium tetanomorphum]MBP1863098.1 DNA-binding PadR family transcriptional regulator [Clostridium tetanomorphum]NRS84207.1 DNA-binding PadR family transcriptional regulator [Clostridium tetanomorphum]NRZ97420.1 DNA-binding PadR family transcriptional regulator [Clostridium tetanomorphum]
MSSFEDTKAEEKRLYEEYKKKLENLKKVEREKEAVGQVFTKGLLPLYVLFILNLSPTNGNDIAHQIGERTNGLWIPSTGGIYPLLKKFEKQKLVEGKWDDSKKKMQKIYTLTEMGYKELDEKKDLLKNKIEEALKVFNTVYKDLYK